MVTAWAQGLVCPKPLLAWCQSRVEAAARVSQVPGALEEAGAGVRGLRWCPCPCRGGTCHPHHGSPALPAASARAPCPGKRPQPHGALPGPWHLGKAWHCMVEGSRSNPCISHECDGRSGRARLGLGVERMGNAGAVPQSPSTGQRISSSKGRRCSQQSLHGLSMEPKISPCRSTAR